MLLHAIMCLSWYLKMDDTIPQERPTNETWSSGRDLSLSYLLHITMSLYPSDGGTATGSGQPCLSDDKWKQVVTVTR